MTRAGVLAELILTLLQNVAKCDSDLQELLQSFRQRCVLTGETIRCTVNGPLIQGRCAGIDERGELQVWTDAGMRVCRSGEVRRVRLG